MSVDLFIIIVVIIVSCLIIFFITRLLESSEKRKRKINIGALLILFFLISFLKPYLLTDYPDPKSTYSRENMIIRQYNPDESYTIKKIGKLKFINDIGLVYISEIKAVNDSYIRMFFRTVGMVADEVFDADIELIDEKNRAYDFSNVGGGVRSALIISSAQINFYSETDSINEIRKIKINDTELDL